MITKPSIKSTQDSPVDKALKRLQQLSKQYNSNTQQISTITQKKNPIEKSIFDKTLTIRHAASQNFPTTTTHISQQLNSSQSQVLFQLSKQTPKIRTFATMQHLPSSSNLQNELNIKQNEVQQLKAIVKQKDTKIKQQQHTISQLNIKLVTTAKDVNKKQRRSLSKQRQVSDLRVEVISLKGELKMQQLEKQRIIEMYQHQFKQQQVSYQKQIEQKNDKILKLLQMVSMFKSGAADNSMTLSLASLSIDSNI